MYFRAQQFHNEDEDIVYKDYRRNEIITSENQDFSDVFERTKVVNY